MKQQENVILIGMSGAGKSTLGVLLAKALGKSFVDTDLIIQQHTGMRLQEILDTRGVDAVLQVEEEVVSGLDLRDTVIATGGSVVYSDKAMQALRKSGVTVYLQVPYDRLIKRLTNVSTRGIVFKNRNDLRSVYEERLPLYEGYADLTLECGDGDVEQTLEKLLRLL